MFFKAVVELVGSSEQANKDARILATSSFCFLSNGSCILTEPSTVLKSWMCA